MPPVTDSSRDQHKEMAEAHARSIFCDFVGTLIFVFVGCAISVLAGPSIGAFGIAAGFGLAYACVVICFGGFKRVHLNPGLTLAIWISEWSDNSSDQDNSDKSSRPRQLWFLRIMVQFLGALFGAVLLLLLLRAKVNHLDIGQLGLSQNGWGIGFGSEYSVWGVLIVETIGSVLFFAVAIRAMSKDLPNFVAPLIAGIGLFAAHLLAYPVSGASLNTARSFGPEIVSWASEYILFPSGFDVAFAALCNSLIELLVFALTAIIAAFFGAFIATSERHS